MDILQWLKFDHTETQGLLDALTQCVEEAAGEKVRKQQLFNQLSKQMLGHLKAESELVLPEIIGRFSGSDVLIDLCHANHKVVVKYLKSLAISLDADKQDDILEALAKVRLAVTQHVEVQESQLLAKLRQSIPTAEREDIGQLVSDFLSEYRQESTDIIEELAKSQKSLRSAANTRARA